MKVFILKVLSITCALSLLALQASARTWTSSDDASKTFTGDLKKYDSETKLVTITRTNGGAITFSIDKLSESDQKWVIASKISKADEAKGSNNIQAKLEAQKIGKNVFDILTKLNEKKLEKTELEFAPEYYLLYFSASW